MRAMPRQAPQGTQAVQRALALLRSFTPEAPEHRLSDLAAAHGLHPSTAHRLLGVLEAEGLIGRSPDSAAYRRRPDRGVDIGCGSAPPAPARRNGLRPLEPLRTPFHRRTAALCESGAWRDWSGCSSALSYEPTSEREYWAVRNAAALIDVSPLFKYEVVGADAERLLDRVMTRDMTACRVGQVCYSSWCNEDGHLLQDGNVQRLAQDRFLVSAAEPTLRWLEDCGFGMDTDVRDVSADIGALALQGPRARAVAAAAVTGIDFAGMRYFELGTGEVAGGGVPVTVTRTGYTGDLGYELWVEAEHAEALWDALAAAGADHGLLPAGLLALDMARVEAGLVLIDVDYVSASHAEIDALKVTPAEAGLGFTVRFEKCAEFVGRSALERERGRRPAWAMVGLEVDWFELERLWSEIDLRPQVVGQPAAREPTPVLAPGGRQVGQCTSRFFSPLLKKYIGLATVRADAAVPGAELDLELAVGYSRRRARARVVQRPFFEPARKTAVGPALPSAAGAGA